MNQLPPPHDRDVPCVQGLIKVRKQFAHLCWQGLYCIFRVSQTNEWFALFYW